MSVRPEVVLLLGAGGVGLLALLFPLLLRDDDPPAPVVGTRLVLAAGGEGDEEREPSGLWAGPMVAAMLAGAVLLAIVRVEDTPSAERLALEGKVWWVW